MINPYATLDVSKESTPAEIKKAYRRLAMKFHPDRNPGDTEAESKFKEVSHAYEILSDPEKKNNEDMFGSAGAQPAGFPGGFESGGSPFDIFDMFGDVFGQPRQRRPQRNQPGKDIRITATIGFLDSIFGSQKDLKVNVNAGCVPCAATGSETRKTLRCSVCGGTGFVIIRQAFMKANARCHGCSGKGQTPEKQCAPCTGTGMVNSLETIKVSIPPGVDDNSTLRLVGRGHANQFGAHRGNMLITLNVERHEEFIKDGKHIHSNIYIPFNVAALGGVVPVSTVHGTQTVKIASGTQCNSTLRLRRKGVPGTGPRPTGHHFVKVIVSVPKDVTDQQRELIKKLKL
jgi:molecular chaperone DnaJ